MGAAGQLLGQEAQTGLQQQQLAQQLRLGLGEERLGLGREAQAQQELASRERQAQQALAAQIEASRGQQAIGAYQAGTQRYQAGTQQYGAETTRISQENDVLLRNLAENNKFQQFLMQMGFDKARLEAAMRQAAQGQTAEMLKILTQYQSTLGAGGMLAANKVS